MPSEMGFTQAIKSASYLWAIFEMASMSSIQPKKFGFWMSTAEVLSSTAFSNWLTSVIPSGESISTISVPKPFE